MKLFRFLAAQLFWFVALLFRLAEAQLKWFIAVLLLAGGFAFAQDVPVPTTPGIDLHAWGSNAGIFGGFILFLVALIRSRIKSLDGWWVVALSFVLSEGGAAGLYYGGFLTDPQYASYPPPQIWILFGFSAFVFASGGWAALLMALSARHPKVTATATAALPATPDSPATPPIASVVVNPTPQEGQQ